jgi:hypothetical protein
MFLHLKTWVRTGKGIPKVTIAYYGFVIQNNNCVPKMWDYLQNTVVQLENSINNFLDMFEDQA